MPRSQGVGAEDPEGQKNPGGHRVAVPVLLQKYPAAQALHVILRTALDAPPSATYTLPYRSDVMPDGLLNLAATPMPSEVPEDPPATVVTVRLPTAMRLTS